MIAKDKTQGYKKDGFFGPDRAPKQEFDAAQRRLAKALNQFPKAVLFSRKNRATETLYVGNLAFNTSKEDLSEELDYYFCIAVIVEGCSSSWPECPTSRSSGHWRSAGPVSRTFRGTGTGRR